MHIGNLAQLQSSASAYGFSAAAAAAAAAANALRPMQPMFTPGSVLLVSNLNEEVSSIFPQFL
jgi:hypothetical protein